jgi:hypothetical protein
MRERKKLRDQRNMPKHPSTPIGGNRHIHKSYNIERPEFWPIENQLRELEYENPELRTLPYFQEIRQNFREQADRDEREPRISVARSISMVREPPLERVEIRVIPTHPEKTTRSFIEDVLNEGTHRLRYSPGKGKKPIPWTLNAYRKGKLSYSRLVPSPDTFGSMPAYDMQTLSKLGRETLHLWNYRILRYEPLITGVYLANDRWAVINLQTSELLHYGPAEGLIPVSYSFDHHPPVSPEVSAMIERRLLWEKVIKNLGEPGTSSNGSPITNYVAGRSNENKGRIRRLGDFLKKRKVRIKPLENDARLKKKVKRVSLKRK